MKSGKRTLALLLALLLLLTGLTACGGGGKSETTPEYVYVPTYYKLGGGSDIQGVNASAFGTNVLYLMVQKQDGTSTYIDPTSGESWEHPVYKESLYRVDLATGEMKELSGYVSAAATKDGYSGVSAMAVDANGTLWLIENSGSYSGGGGGGIAVTENGAVSGSTATNASGESTPAAASMLLKLGEDGAVQQKIDLNAACKTNTSFSNLACQGGNLCISDGTNVYVVSADGALQYQVPIDTANSWFNGMVQRSDGKVAVVLDSGDTHSMYPLDDAAKALGAAETMPYSSYSLYRSNSSYLFCYNNGQSLYGFKSGATDGEKLFDWISSDINVDNVSNVCVLSEDQVACLIRETNNQDGTMSLTLALMKKTPYSQVAQRKVITLAAMYLDSGIRDMVLQFNRTSQEYRIEVTDYSEYNTDKDYTAGQTKLSTEIISGNVPDILVNNGLPLDQYGSKGLLEDLWPYIDKDMGRDALVQAPLKAMSTADGKLYQIISGFNISTVVTRKDYVGSGSSGWTLQEMTDAFKKLPEGSSIFNEYDTRDNMLTMCVMNAMNRFVNWTTGECSFDSDDFRSLLEFVNTFPTEYNWDNVDWNTMQDGVTRVRNGKQLAASISISAFGDIPSQLGALLGKYAYVGYPGGGVGSYSFYGGLAMSSKSQYKDAVWQFIRQTLQPDYNNMYGGFPINKASFDKSAKEAMKEEYTTDASGNQVRVPKYTWTQNGQDYSVYALTQEDYDNFIQMMNSITDVMSYNEKIQGIIQEEATNYFNGQSTSQAAAEMIQSRVKLYVNEQK